MKIWLDTGDVALLLRLSLFEVFRLVEQKVLTPVLMPYGWRFYWPDIDKYRHRGVS